MMGPGLAHLVSQAPAPAPQHLHTGHQVTKTARACSHPDVWGPP